MNINWSQIIYNSGDVFLPEFIRNALGTIIYKYPNSEINYTFYIQGWTFIHFVNGIIFGYLYLYFGYIKKYYFMNMFILHTLWELWQIIIGMSKPWNIIGRNNIIDILVDTSSFLLGSYLILHLRKN
jgi:hypothetical protein